MATLLLGLILTVCFGLRVTDGQAHRFVLNGVNYTNGSIVLRSDIGEGDAGLQCTTDRVDCCRRSDGAAAGEFYFPDDTQVPILASAPSDSYYRDRGTGFIRLNRRPTTTLTGEFRCEIPDASGTLVNLCINIVITSISITAFGTNTAGVIYSLECSATVNGSTDQLTITWLDPMNNPVPSEMVTITSSMNTLTFSPLTASHLGTYTCRVTSGGVTWTQTSTVIVNVITAQVSRSSSGPLTAGQTGFSLSCNVTGTDNLNTPTVTYQWQKNSGVISGQQGSILSLSPLSASNAGEYNCSVTVISTSLSSIVTVNSINTEIVSIQLPAPTSVTATNGSVNVGSDVTLTCTVELSPVDVPVTVNTVWIGPAGFMTTNTAQPVMGSTTTYTSTAIVSTFGRDQSGVYTCTATVSSTSSFLTNSMASSSTPLRVTVGVYLSLKGVIYPNNSVISMTEIEQTNTTSNNGLQCITDRRPCCRDSLAGEWFFPDNGGVVLPVSSGPTTFYRNRDYDGAVNLNRVNTDVMMPTGRFCCVVPDANGVDQTVCASIVSVTIATIGSPTAGASYTLKCSVNGTSDPASYQWFGPPNGESITNTTSRMIFSNSSLSLLEFCPLQAFHDGVYTCRATVNIVVMVENSINVNINSPSFTATIRDNGATPTLGQQYHLICGVTDAELLTSPTLTYQWTKNNRTQSQVGANSSTLSFDSLKLSDAGQYTCEVTITSVSLNGNIVVTASKIVKIKIPAPTNVTVTPPFSTIIAGSSPNLTCTVTLSTAVDVPVNVTTTWTVPDGVIVYSNQLFSNNLMHHTSTTTFTAARSGNYTCRATVSPSSQFTTGSGTASGTFNIIVAPLPAPTNLVITQSLATSISLSWEQPLGANAVNSYQINYNYTINECSRDNLSQGSVNVGNVTSFTLINNSGTPVEEDSTYFITVTAINVVTNSTSSEITTITSAAAPSGTPQNLIVIFVNATNIRVQWGEVACQHRNGMIDGYQISYSGKNVTVFRGKTFTANRLLPRKQYTFSVNAFSTFLGAGPQVTITNETSVLQEVSFVLKNVIYGNNSIVSVEDIAENDEALLCYTNSVECCENHQQVGSDYWYSRQWYFSSGSSIGVNVTGGDFYRDRGPSVVSLNRRNNTMMPTGVFRCEIPDASGAIQNIYVGIYPLKKGTPAINNSLSYRYDRNQSLKCTSIGGPATSVVWLKNGLVLGAEYDQHKSIINETSSKYQNELLLGQQSPEDIIGNYTCLVRNSRGENARSIQLYGLQTTMIEEAIPLDSSLSINCTTDLAVTSLEWLDSDNNLLINTSEAYLVLVIDGITADHNKLNYTCRVISPFGNQTKSVTFYVDQLPTSSVGGGTEAAAPPLNVQATQSSASSPVEVSWSPPSGGAATITSYRIFYGNGDNISVLSVVTRIILALNEDSLGQTVSVRSEADQLASQLITVTIKTPQDDICSCALDVGVTVGVMLLLVCVVAMVIIVVFIHILRKRRSGKNDLDQSSSMPTQLYEDPDKLTSSGQGNYKLTECPAYESTTTKPQPHSTEADQSSHYEL